MPENTQTPEFARLFADRIERDGMGRTDAIIDTVDKRGQIDPAVYIRLLPGMTFEEAKLAAERAKTAAVWAFARSAGNGVVLDTRHFATLPEYVIQEASDGAIVFAWINAVSAVTDAPTFERVKTAASAAAAEYREALEKGTWATVQYGIQRRPYKPTYAVSSLQRDTSDPVYKLMQGMGIK